MQYNLAPIPGSWDDHHHLPAVHNLTCRRLDCHGHDDQQCRQHTNIDVPPAYRANNNADHPAPDHDQDPLWNKHVDNNTDTTVLWLTPSILTPHFIITNDPKGRRQPR